MTAIQREAALQPLRAALIARANDEAAEARAAAEDRGRQAAAAAHSQAAVVLAAARAHGEADAAALLAAERARVRRTARGVVLAAQRAVYDELRRQAGEAVRQLLDDPAQRERLVAAVGRQLGAQAAFREQPDGGVIAETPDGRSIGASVGALVERAVADLDLEPLWAAT
jgi:vacuolar-type H+-ATPase subunit E/Vma4